MSAIRNRQFRLLLCLFIPILFFILTETAMRLLRVGYDPSFVRQMNSDQGPAIRDNPAFFYRFFPKPLARTTGRFSLPMVKQADDIRIFVYGSSAAMGDPDFSYSFSRMLEKMLQMSHPQKRFQVINTAATAVNSHVILPIARECRRLQPDVAIVYMGNNEVIGPYGPATRLTPVARHYRLLRASIWLRSTKWGQLIDAVRGKWRSEPPELQQWGGLELFLDRRIRADDPQLTRVYDFFDRNLRRIGRAMTRQQTPLLLCTVPTNLTACPPFLSLHAPTLTPAQQEQWQLLFQSAEQARVAGDVSQAMDLYRQAAEVDSGYALLYYRLAQSAQAAEDAAAAESAYVRARDLDALRFRADSRLNHLIRQAATRDGATLIDLDQQFTRASSSAAAEDLFFDHVHLSLYGNYIMAQTLFPLVESRCSLTPAAPPTLEQVMRALAYTGWDALRLQEEMTQRLQRPPFTEQAEQMLLQTSRARQSLMQPLREPQALARAKSWYEAAIAQWPTDWVLQENYGQFTLTALDDPQTAESCFQAVFKALPGDALTCGNLGLAAAELGKWQEAEGFYRDALAMMPNLTQPATNLTRALLAQDKLAEAAQLLERTRLSPSTAAELHNSIGIRYAEMGEPNEALSHFKRAVTLDANFGQAYFNLGMLYQQQNDLSSALNAQSRAVQLLPQESKPRQELALGLTKAGRYEEAITHYLHLIRQNPDATEPHHQLGLLYAQLGQMDAAIAEFETVISLAPDNLAALSNLAMAAGLAGRSQEAIEHLKKISRIARRPEYPYKIGLEFLKRNQPDSARRYFVKAFELQADFMPAIEKLDSLDGR